MKDRFLLALLLVSALIVVGLLFFRRETGPSLDTRAVVTEIRQMNELVTVRYTIQKIVGLKEERVPIGNESILLVMQAQVHAGIDLSGLRPEDVSTRPDQTIVVRIPRAKLVNVVVDEKETKVWDRQKTWWTPWVPFDVDMERRARLAGIDSIKQAALDMGILPQAEQNADRAIRALLKLAGVNAVVILPQGIS